MEHFFPPNSSGHLRSDPHPSQIIGRDAYVDHTQIIGGIYPPRVSAPLITIVPQFTVHEVLFKERAAAARYSLVPKMPKNL